MANEPDMSANAPKLNEPSMQRDSASASPSDESAVDSLLDSVLGSSEGSSAKEPVKTTEEGIPLKSPESIPQPGDKSLDSIKDVTNKAIPQPGDTKPVEPEVPIVPPVVDPAKVQEPVDDEVAKIEMPKGMNPKRSEDWKKLQSVAVERGRKLKEVEPRLAELQAQVQQLTQQASSKDLPDEMKAYIKELEDFRSAHDMLHDKEFVDKYFKPMADVENNVMDLLEKHGMTKDNVAILRQQGILGTSNETWKMILDTLQETNPVSRERLGKLLGDFYNLNDDQQRQLADAPKRVEEYRRRKIEEANIMRQNYEKTVNSEIDRLRKIFPQSSKQEIPPNATAEQKAIITAHNANVDRIEKDFTTTFRALQSRDPKTMAETVAAALLSVAQASEIAKLSQSLKDRDLRIAQLEEKVSAGRHIEAPPRSVTPSKGSKPALNHSLNDRLRMRDEEAIDSGLDALGA